MPRTGNWAANLSSGSATGYKLLFAILLSSLIGILLQSLCVRMGIVTGMDLAQASRRLILGGVSGKIDTRRYRELTTGGERFWYVWKRTLLWSLYAIAEVAIIATELAELIGSAIAINLLIPRIPLWGGVLITTADVLLILMSYSPEKSTRVFEAFIGVLMLVTLICFCILVHQVHPQWGEVFYGFVPSSTLIQGHSIYLSVGIIGATVMPHSLFLGSRFSTANRLEQPIRPCGGASELESSAEYAQASAPKRYLLRARHTLGRAWPKPDPSGQPLWRRWAKGLAKLARPIPSDQVSDSTAPRPPLPLHLIRIHLPHATADIVSSLLVMALTINSLILIVAGAAFYYNSTGDGGRERGKEVGSLQDAYNLLRSYLGKGSAIVFSIALLASAEAASVTVTLAGQIVSEGFIRWKVHPFTRRLLTRLIAMVPSLAVCIAVGEGGLNSMLLASQVILSVCLPFLMLPLIIITGFKRTMRVKSNHSDSSIRVATTLTAVGDTSTGDKSVGDKEKDEMLAMPGDVPMWPLSRIPTSTPKQALASPAAEAEEIMPANNAPPRATYPLLLDVVPSLPASAGPIPSPSHSPGVEREACQGGGGGAQERPFDPQEEYTSFANNWFWNVLNTAVFLFLCVAVIAALVQSL